MIANMDNNSQRGAETEVIELIANLIASYSHHYELYNSIQDELDNAYETDTIVPDDLVEEAKWHFDKMSELTFNRRKAMKQLFNMGWEVRDEKMWCLVKHAIASYQFSQELLATDEDNQVYIWLAQNASKYMYQCVSRFLWVELVTCWRCLKDALDESK